MIDPAALSEAERLKAKGATVDEILLLLRKKGANKIDSINAIRSLFGKSLNDAKILVDHSDAWADRFDGDVVLKDRAIQELLDSINPDDNGSGE